uniref:Gluzincin n=1 Tax=Rhipicephalus zambeziensis TaxID=60191 RepID=A0A224Y9C3_9ACAR
MKFLGISAVKYIFAYLKIAVTLAASGHSSSGTGAAEEDDSLCSHWCNEVASTVDNSEDGTPACTDFFAHICKPLTAKMSKASDSDTGLTKYEDSYLEKQLIENIKGILEEGAETESELLSRNDNSNSESQILDLAKQLYQACTKAPRTISKSALKSAVQEMLEPFKLTDWPLKDMAPTATVQDILRNAGLRPVATLKAVGSEEEQKYLLSITVPKARFAPSANVMSSPEKHSGIFIWYRRLLRNIIKLFCSEENAGQDSQNDEIYKTDDSGEIMSADEGDNRPLSPIVTDILEVEQKLGEITIKALTHTKEEICTVEDLEKRLGKKFPLLDGLKKDFEKSASSVSLQDRVVVRLPTYFEELASYLATVDARKLYNYYGWYHIREIADALTENIRDKLNSFLRNASKPGVPVELSDSACVKNLIGSDGLIDKGITYLYLKKHLGKSVLHRANKLSHHINKTFSKFIKDNTWMEPETKDSMHKWISDLQYHVGASEKLFDETEVSKLYKDVKLRVMPSMPLYYFNARENNFKQMLALCKSSFIKNSVWPLSALDTRPIYYSYYVSLEFPAGLLQKPIYESEGPTSHNFGAAGSFVGETLASGLTDEGGVWRNMPLETEPDYTWSEGSKEKFLQLINNCMEGDKPNKKQQKNAKIDLKSKASRIDHESKVLDHIGLRTSYKAFLEFIKECSCSRSINEQSAKRAFFASYAKSHCKPGGHHESTRINYALGTYSEFIEAFGCSESDPMKLEDSCRIMPP